MSKIAVLAHPTPSPVGVAVVVGGRDEEEIVPQEVVGGQVVA
jgi:hypothetical protein